ncbi:hypothetical protein SSP35_18_00490 [Streptomyces sp. NBRC 110611]|uniref:glycoside hydrolase domain-containing protein n=1 Tax=Streptomyces sp. NBRC 110611 TaxID=1621259 RepID=UPI000831E37D|nr:glycoside hydrolase domain-containing protein [Streptomyces sp. NBRC 110611]GAU70321.1 hypothetical protein SSP35_18_00490 [Streptomyces sp. NBRC 110611]
MPVPDGWQVVDLERSPEACLRLDQPALHLGRAGEQARCTGGAVGERAETVHLEPLEGASQRADIPTVTVSSGTEGFDACTAPSGSQMKAWRKASPYRAVGVYIGGSTRACAQPQLTAEWIRRQAADGWHLMPIWVGPQPWNDKKAPATRLIKNEAGAAHQGRQAADGAVQAAKGLGLGPGAALYNDVEHYNDRKGFDGPVRAYLSAWTKRLHELGYRSGAYVHASSGVQALKAPRRRHPQHRPQPPRRTRPAEGPHQAEAHAGPRAEAPAEASPLRGCHRSCGLGGLQR